MLAGTVPFDLLERSILAVNPWRRKVLIGRPLHMYRGITHRARELVSTKCVLTIALTSSLYSRAEPSNSSNASTRLQIGVE